MKRVLIIAALICAALKLSFTPCASAAESFGEFRLASFNGAKGNLSVSNQTVVLRNSAGDETAVTLAYQRFVGSGQIIARIDHSAGTLAKTGLIFRESTNSVSRYARIFLSGSNIVFERVLATNEPAIISVKTNTAANWLRIVREGDALSGFYSDDGTNWTQLSADTVEMREEIAAGFELIGGNAAAFQGIQMTSARLIYPANHASFTVPTNIWIEAEVKSLGAGRERVEFFADEKKLGVANEPPFKLHWTNALAGERSMAAKVVDQSGAEFFVGPVLCEIKLPAAKAEFVETDDTTRGGWKAKFGAEGFLIVRYATNIPPYAELSSRGHRHILLNYSNDPSALELSDKKGRIVAQWYSYTNMVVNVSLLDGRTHQIAFYFHDSDSNLRVQQVEVIDAVSDAVLDTKKISSFHSGKYLMWNICGAVKFRITAINGNAVVSGIFFDASTWKKANQ